MKRKDWINLGMLAALAGALWMICFFCPGCHAPTKTWTAGAVSCATDAVRNNWGRAYPEVQTCLTSLDSDPIKCLDAIPGLISVGVDVVACIVRGSGQEASMQANRNPDDALSRRKAERANMYLIAHGFEFQE